MEPRPSLRGYLLRWVFPTVLASILISGAILALHSEQEETLREATQVLSELRSARVDLAEGLLQVLQGTDPRGPWQVGQGRARIDQALEEMRQSGHGSQAGLASAQVEALQQALALPTESTEARERRDLAVRLAAHEVDLTARRLDELQAERLASLSARSTRRFRLALAVAGLVMVGLCGAMVQAGRGRLAADTALEQSRQQLLISLERFAGVARASHEVVWERDLGAGRWFWGESLSSTLGHSVSEAAEGGEAWWLAHVHPEDRGRVALAWAQTRGSAQARWSLGYRFAHANGSYAEVFDRGERQGDPGPAERWVGAIQDLSAQRAAEAGQQESERRFALVFERSPLAISISRLEDGRIIDFNESYRRLFGHRREVLEGSNALDLGQWVKPADRLGLVATLRREQRVINTELNLRRASGETFVGLASCELIELDGQPRMLTMISDVSELKEAELAIRESEERLQTVIENLDEGLILATADGQTIHWNRAALRLHGYRDLDECLLQLPEFQAVYELYTLDGRKLSYEEWPLPRLLRHEPLGELQLRLSRIGSDWERTFRYGGGLIKSRGQDLAFLTVSDVTERRRAEERRARADRLEALGALAGEIAHDFNNVVTAIQSNAELIVEDLPPGHPALESVHQIAAAGRRAAALASRILRFSRSRPEERTAIAVLPVVAEALTLVRVSTPARVDLQSELDPDLPPVAIDPTELHRLVLNLLMNAVQAIDGVGRIIVRLQQGLEGRANSGLRPGPYLRLTVSDNGCGMAPNTVARIFEPFFSTKGDKRGTGLGLAVVQGIVQTASGALRVESAPGQGTTFVIDLPAQAAPVPVLVPATIMPPGTGPRLIYVDDDPTTLLLVERALLRLGYQVTACTSSAEALVRFREQSQGFDWVVSELGMPQLSGLDLAQQLLEIRRETKILITTQHASADNEARAKSIGVLAMVPKPRGAEELAALIDGLVRQAKQSGANGVRSSA